MNNNKPKDKCALCDLNINGKGKILEVFHTNKALRQRLLDMGLTKGTVVTIKKISPLGDPLDLSLRDYELCLRRNDLKNIEVEVIK